MKYRKPAIVACILLALALISLPLAWLWYRWETEWLRPEAELRPPMTAGVALLVVRVDGLAPGDLRIQDVRSAAASAFPVSLNTVQEGHTHSRSFPRSYAWFGTWMNTADFNDAFALEYRRQFSERLKLHSIDVRCRVGVVRHDGKILDAN